MIQPRIFCIGRNYSEHVKELNNTVPTSPVVFMKPLSSLSDNTPAMRYPAHGQQLQYEAEVVVQIGKSGRPNNDAEAQAYISAVSVGLDMTLRDVQQNLKQQGLPWELAKSFDDSARIAPWVSMNDNIDLSNLSFACTINKELRQSGNTASMLNPILNLICYISTVWQLVPGDCIFTGTPQGVGDVQVGDVIELMSDELGLQSGYIIV